MEKFCTECKTLGHAKEDCRRLVNKVPGKQVWKPRQQQVGEVSQVNVNISYMTAQLIHCHISSISSKKEFWCTFVYAYNTAVQIEDLWRDLVGLSDGVRQPWVVLGDFNSVLNREDRIGLVVRESEMVPFRRCISQCGLDDMKSCGSFYTWSKKVSKEFFAKLT